MHAFEEKKVNGKTVIFGQDLDGLYWAEIRDEWGAIESYGEFKTCTERDKWTDEITLLP